MAGEQISQNEFIMQAVAKAARVATEPWPQLAHQGKAMENSR